MLWTLLRPGRESNFLSTCDPPPSCNGLRPPSLVFPGPQFPAGAGFGIEVCTAREVGVHGVPLYPGAAHSPCLLATRHPFLRTMLCPGASQITSVILSPGKSRAAWGLMVSRSVTLPASSPLDWLQPPCSLAPPTPYYSPRNSFGLFLYGQVLRPLVARQTQVMVAVWAIVEAGGTPS